MINSILTWIVGHWIIVGLGLSEILALFPGKYNGIIQTIWKLLTAVVVKK